MKIGLLLGMQFSPHYTKKGVEGCTQVGVGGGGEVEIEAVN